MCSYTPTMILRRRVVMVMMMVMMMMMAMMMGMGMMLMILIMMVGMMIVSMFLLHLPQTGRAVLISCTQSEQRPNFTFSNLDL